jgi:serine/threonine protein kinase
MPVTWIQVRDVLDEVLPLAPEDRSRYLDCACPQPELRRYIDSLIISYEKADGFLEQPASAQHAELSSDTESSEVWIGRRIGPYRIEKEIGEGGMGTVFRAVRADDEYQKQVAIKLLRGGFASSFAVGRFKTERQILAGLEHPNIARLLDGGRTEEGYPYLVMELVNGVPIDQYCDTHTLTIVKRLQLFRTVCDAVQFAHQNLVIHRDLKPANILVSADGVPKLLDFGIAKLVTDESLSPPERTVSFLRMMTPEYASPEQVRGDPISTATDTYSLGVVLYFLLTGHHPYRLTDASPQALVKVICDTEPLKPSEIVSRTETIGDLGENGILTVTPESVSSSRGSKPEKLRHRLSGDLDNVLLMALRKDPYRRYSSVEQFSDDVRRHLRGLPVRAREDTLAYRGSRFVKRHKMVVVASTLFVITLLGGIVATARQARIALAERAKAERRFNDVRRLATSLIFDVHDSIQNLPGATPVRKLIVDRAVHYLDSLETEAPDDVDLQRELAWAYQRVGLVQGDLFAGNLGDSGGALESIRKASHIWEGIAKGKSATLDDQINNAYGHRVLSNMLAGAMEPGSREQGRQAVLISEHLFQIAPTHARVRRELGRDYESLAGHEEWQGDYAAALADLRKAYQLQKETLRASPADPESQRGFAELSVKIGQDLAYLGFREMFSGKRRGCLCRRSQSVRRGNRS